MTLRATIVALPLVVGVAYTAGTMRGVDWTPAPEAKPTCYAQVQLGPDAASRLYMPCETVPLPVLLRSTVIDDKSKRTDRVHAVKLFYDRVEPDEVPPARAATAAPGKNAAGCKPGRTRNRYGICGRWR